MKNIYTVFYKTKEEDEMLKYFPYTLNVSMQGIFLTNTPTF